MATTKDAAPVALQRLPTAYVGALLQAAGKDGFKITFPTYTEAHSTRVAIQKVAAAIMREAEHGTVSAKLLHAASDVRWSVQDADGTLRQSGGGRAPYTLVGAARDAVPVAQALVMDRLRAYSPNWDAELRVVLGNNVIKKK